MSRVGGSIREETLCPLKPMSLGSHISQEVCVIRILFSFGRMVEIQTHSTLSPYYIIIYILIYRIYYIYSYSCIIAKNLVNTPPPVNLVVIPLRPGPSVAS